MKSVGWIIFLGIEICTFALMANINEPGKATDSGHVEYRSENKYQEKRLQFSVLSFYTIASGAPVSLRGNEHYP